MVNIYLARHGQDEDNAKGILNGRRNKGLTPLGKEQAREVGKKMKKAKIKIDHVYTSPLERGKQTAQIIAEELGVKDIKILDDLTERDFGEMTGVPISRIREMCEPYVLDNGVVRYFLYPKNGETFPQLVERAKRMLNEIHKKHKKGNILLVSHGDFGKMIYTAYYNLDWDEVLRMFHFGNSEVLLLSKKSNPEETHFIKVKQYQA